MGGKGKREKDEGRRKKGRKEGKAPHGETRRKGERKREGKEEGKGGEETDIVGQKEAETQGDRRGEG